MKTIQKYLTSVLVVGAFIIGLAAPLVANATGNSDITPLPPVYNVTADAGPDKTITLPTSSVTLVGSSTGFNGFVPPTYSWTKISGSGMADSPSSSTTTISNLTVGTSVFLLTVDDNVYNATDTVSIFVNPAGLGGGGTGNGATVNAGPDQILYYPTDSTVLSGSSTGINGIVLYYTWTSLSGSASFGSPNAASTDVSRLSLGDNEFRLTVTNNTGTTAFDDVIVTVRQAGAPLNIPPTAYAGPDQVLYLPTSTAYLVGNGTDIDGRVISYAWSKLSGSGTINTTTGSSSGDAVTITGLTLGDSVFHLTVTDDQGATGTDDLTIKVLSSGGGCTGTGCGGCTGTGCGGGGTGSGGGSGGGTGGGGFYVCPVGTTGIYPNCIVNTSNINAVYFIKTAKVNIRASASVSSTKVVTVKRNTLLEVLEGTQSSIWIKVKTSSNQVGYVMARYTQPLVKIGNKAVITQKLVNIRASESSRSKSLRTIKKTDIVDVLYVSPITSWAKIKLANGTTGFVNKFLLKAI